MTDRYELTFASGRVCTVAIDPVPDAPQRFVFSVFDERGEEFRYPAGTRRQWSYYAALGVAQSTLVIMLNSYVTRCERVPVQLELVR